MLKKTLFTLILAMFCCTTANAASVPLTKIGQIKPAQAFVHAATQTAALLLVPYAKLDALTQKHIVNPLSARFPRAKNVLTHTANPALRLTAVFLVRAIANKSIDFLRNRFGGKIKQGRYMPTAFSIRDHTKDALSKTALHHALFWQALAYGAPIIKRYLKR